LAAVLRWRAGRRDRRQHLVTEPAMAATVGSIIFVVVVVGGMGSLAGAFLASLLIGVMQTFAVAFDYSLAPGGKMIGVAQSESTFWQPLLKLTISQVAPILPYLFLVLILIFRPKGLLGTREGMNCTTTSCSRPCVLHRFKPWNIGRC
jgi:branched-chain amino acid transport system permease protein